MSTCSNSLADIMQPVHTLEETSMHLYNRGLIPRPLDKGGMQRFEQRLFRKLRHHPTIRELYRDRFGRCPDQ